MRAPSATVDAHGQAVALVQLRALVPRYAHHQVFAVEQGFLRLLAGAVAVVDLVSPPVVEEAQSAGRAFIVILQHGRRHAARDARIVVRQGGEGLAGVGGVEVRHVHVAPQAPVLCQVIRQLGIAAVLLESHVRSVSVGAVVGEGGRAAEASLAHAVDPLGLHRAVGACTQVDVRPYPVLVHLAGDDVDDAAHGVGAVEHGGRPAQHFDALGQHRLVGVGDGVAEEAHVLRMPVDEHQHLRTAREAAET